MPLNVEAIRILMDRTELNSWELCEDVREKTGGRLYRTSLDAWLDGRRLDSTTAQQIDALTKYATMREYYDLKFFVEPDPPISIRDPCGL